MSHTAKTTTKIKTNWGKANTGNQSSSCSGKAWVRGVSSKITERKAIRSTTTVDNHLQTKSVSQSTIRNKSETTMTSSRCSWISRWAVRITRAYTTSQWPSLETLQPTMPVFKRWRTQCLTPSCSKCAKVAIRSAKHQASSFLCSLTSPSRRRWANAASMINWRSCKSTLSTMWNSWASSRRTWWRAAYQAISMMRKCRLRRRSLISETFISAISSISINSRSCATSSSTSPAKRSWAWKECQRRIWRQSVEPSACSEEQSRVQYCQ